MDPIDFRRRNLVAPDDEMADGTAWGGIGLDECLARLAEHPLWRDRATPPGRRRRRPRRRRLAGRPPARVGDLPPRARWPGHRGDRRRRHLGHDDRLRDPRRRRPRHRQLGDVSVTSAPTPPRRPASPVSGGRRHHLLDRPGRPAGDRRAPREDPGLRIARCSRSTSATSSSSTAPSGRRVRPRAGMTLAQIGEIARRVHAPTSSRWRGTAGRSRRSSRR